MLTSITNGRIYMNQKFVEDHVLLFNEKILDICSLNSYEDYKKSHSIKEINANKMWLVPGFIDVHIHGYEGIDVMDGEIDALVQLSKSLLKNGVTAYLPTTMTMSLPEIEKALKSIRSLMENEAGMNQFGAMVLGAHLEGPFINEGYKGAQAEEFIQLPNKALIEAFKDVIKVITIAPELPGAMECIKTYAQDIRFSLGHSGASFEQAMEAFSSGATCVTHLFNAMTGLHHRNPGLVGASFASDSYCEVIADGIHVDSNLFPLIVKAKKLNRILLMTDCMRAGGLEEGTHDLGGQKVTLKNKACRLEDGTLAGSVLTLWEALKNFQEALEESLEEVLPLVTINQASYLGLEKEMGTLDIGKWANITIIDPSITIKKQL